ncbi:hypothetical protein [Pseudomonas moorei]|uniref:hypothetical protein n=1 Tax=Pseudomonas moorei TaxID=395599 RepID=UPI001FF2B9EF|nr:hypothetical protein [Pseudomonas moorei]
MEISLILDDLTDAGGQSLMNSDLKILWQRERRRREALWDLEVLWPGNAMAKPYLAILDELITKIANTR